MRRPIGWRRGRIGFETSLPVFSALLRLWSYRENAFSSKDYNRLRSQFESDWKNFLSIHVNSEIVRMAGDLAEKHGLRGFDAVHLASAVTLREKLASPVTFSCYDIRLQNASQREKLDQPL